mmetsp:Transcript_37977/g.69417  ORF Transcript_37977/g.69417 Transcript_37977/m.69417 type:complete len:83 (-) Transcript_37977:889-1137(-)
MWIKDQVKALSSHQNGKCVAGHKFRQNKEGLRLSEISWNALHFFYSTGASGSAGASSSSEAAAGAAAGAATTTTSALRITAP